MQVESGPFAWQFIPYFNDELYSSTAYIYNGSSTTGLLRGATNANSNAYLTRYPVKNIINFLASGLRFRAEQGLWGLVFTALARTWTKPSDARGWPDLFPGFLPAVYV